MHKLTFRQPAELFEEALPLGNGRIGAVIYGGVGRERIALNEDTLWTGGPADVNVYGIPDNIDDVRQLLRDQKYTEACRRTVEMLSPHDVQAYQLAGNVHFDFNTDDDCSRYQRELDLATAVSTIAYQQDDLEFRRESFTSAPHQVMATRLSCNKDRSISFSLSADSLMHHQIRIVGNELELSGACPRRNGDSKRPRVWEEDGKTGVPYVMTVRVVSETGNITSTDTTVDVEGADEVIVLITIQSGFVAWDQEPNTDFDGMRRTCREVLDVAAEAGWDALKEEHCREYVDVYSRMTLDLGEYDDRPTDEILKSCTDPAENVALTNLLFNYGRYLLISSSRPGTQPGNLQGIWNKDESPVWRADYHTNINLQMNYWPAETCNLAEFAEPLFDYIRDMSVSGRRAAEQIYGARGWCMHHCSDIWRYPQSAGFRHNFSLWPFGGGWLCQHLWEHYLFNRDLEFLRSIMPILKEAAIFFVDYLIEDEEGNLTTSPSCSPENAFVDPETNERVGLCVGSAMDLLIIRELFECVLEGCKILGESDAAVDEIKESLDRLATPVIGRDGRILEYGIEVVEPEPAHRHLSHIYGVYPGWLYTKDRSPDYFEACRKTLDVRGDKSTGWGMAWRVALWARFYDGDRALKVIGRLMTYLEAGEEVGAMSGGGLYANLWDGHPPFQIEGNFGVTAGIAEMLVQSHRQTADGKTIIDLLPALPSAWQTGSVTGVRARGDYTVDVRWENGALAEAVVLAGNNATDACVVCLGDQRMEVELAPGQSRTLKLADLVTM